jgi:hypothetical protein
VSSNRYSSTLKPDPWLRILVLTSGRLLIAAGLVIILILDIAADLRALAGALWIVAGRYELRVLQRRFDALIAIRLFSDGSVAVLNEHEEWQPGQCQSGCIVLRKLVWLRLRTADGTRFTELLCGDVRRSHDWRRLQVIWRHVGAGR